MAIDEILLSTDLPAILRFYRWAESSVSFGYFGRIAEAREFAGDRPLVRRWTGGGIVPHGKDTTYSLIISRADGEIGVRDIYRLTHERIRHALARSGVSATLATSKMEKVSDRCFANPVVADVLENDRKIAGAAQRRTRDGFLLQGSIQRDGLPETFREAMARELSSDCRTLAMDEAQLQRAEKLAAAKYATKAWTERL